MKNRYKPSLHSNKNYTHSLGSAQEPSQNTTTILTTFSKNQLEQKNDSNSYSKLLAPQALGLGAQLLYEERIRSKALIAIELALDAENRYQIIPQSKEELFKLHKKATPIGRSLLPNYNMNVVADYPDVTRLAMENRNTEAVYKYRDQFSQRAYIHGPFLDNLQRGGRVLVATSLLSSGYKISCSENKLKTAVDESIYFSAGLTGGLAAGNVALAPCRRLGPVAPLCVISATFIGGGLAVQAAEKMLSEHHESTPHTELSKAPLHSAMHVTIEKIAHKASKIWPSAGKYISKTVEMILVGKNSEKRAKITLSNNTLTPTGKIVCPTTAGFTETVVSGLGHASLWTAGTLLALEGPAGCVAASFLIIKGSDVVESNSQFLGDKVEGACHRFFRKSTASSPINFAAERKADPLKELREINFRNSSRY